MNQFSHFIARMRRKSEEERKRITMVASGGLTALIALFWVTANLSAGTFALKDPVPTEGGEAATGLAGAGAALFVPESSEPSLTAVSDAKAEEEPAAEANPTIIPF